MRKSTNNTKPILIQVGKEWNKRYMERIFKLYRQNVGSDFLHAVDLHINPFDPILQHGWSWLQRIEKVTYRTSKGLITNVIRKTPTVIDKSELETVFKPFINKHLASDAFIVFFRDTILPMMKSRKPKPRQTEEELSAELRRNYLRDRKTRRYMYVREVDDDAQEQSIIVRNGSSSRRKNSVPSHSLAQSTYVPVRQESPRKRARRDNVSSSSNGIRSQQDNMSVVNLPAQIEEGETRLLIVTRENDAIRVDENATIVASEEELSERMDPFLEVNDGTLHIRDLEGFKQLASDLSRAKEILQQRLDAIDSIPERMTRFMNRYIAAQEEKERREREEREEAERRRKREEEEREELKMKMFCELLGLEYKPKDETKSA